MPEPEERLGEAEDRLPIPPCGARIPSVVSDEPLSTTASARVRSPSDQNRSTKPVAVPSAHTRARPSRAEGPNRASVRSRRSTLRWRLASRS